MMLSIPQHWRFSPLLASLKTVSGHLSRTGTAGSGHLAKCAGCNCEAAVVPECSCATADFTRQTYPSISVTISGTGSNLPLVTNPPGSTSCPADATCPSIAGTYVVATGSASNVNFPCRGLYSNTFFGPANHACVGGIYGVFIFVRIQTDPDSNAVAITLATGYTQNGVIQTIPGGSTNFGTRTINHTLSNGGVTYDDYQYVLDSECTTECNPVISRAACFDTVGPATDNYFHFQSGGIDVNGCDLSVYTVSVSIL